MASKRDEHRRINRKRARLVKKSRVGIGKALNGLHSDVLSRLGTILITGEISENDVLAHLEPMKNALDDTGRRGVRGGHGEARKRWKKAIAGMSGAQKKRLPRVKELAEVYIERFGGRMVTQSLETSVSRMNTVIRNNLDQSEEIVAEKLQKVKQMNFRQARTIARTETLRAMNSSQLDVARGVGSVTGKRIVKVWVSDQGERTRDTHAAADGQQRELDDAFLVGGESILYPGEGSPENSINCRCSTFQKMLR